MDYVFHLAGVKGSPAMTREKPASFFVPFSGKYLVLAGRVELALTLL